MPVDATLQSFLFVLARVAGVVVFLPVPGYRSAAWGVRAVLAMGLTLALAPKWPVVSGAPAWKLWDLGAEAALGVSVGLVAAWLMEAFVAAMQLLGLQAGYSYASTIDPSTQADSGVLQVLAQLAAGLLFFAAGLDAAMIRVFARSFDLLPPGGFRLTGEIAGAMIGFVSHSFSVGVRMALPVIALLGLVDLALALVGRIEAQMQLLSLAFPIKMLVAMVVVGSAAPLWLPLFERSAARAVELAARMAGGGG